MVLNLEGTSRKPVGFLLKYKIKIYLHKQISNLTFYSIFRGKIYVGKKFKVGVMEISDCKKKPFLDGAAWLRGEVVPIHEAMIPVNDWGLVHSDITYDVVPVRGGAFFRLQEYLDRFQASMTSLNLDPKMDLNQIRTALLNMVSASGLKNSYVSMVCSRGVPQIPGTRDPRKCKNHFYAWCVPYIHIISPEVVRRGASALISGSSMRIEKSSVDPTIKNYHWGDFTRGLFEAKEQKYETVILTDKKGNITEGPGFNVFVVKEGTLITPKEGVLLGITRKTILEIAEELRLTTEVRNLSKGELLKADEVFISSSAGGVIPLVKVDKTTYSKGKTGPITEQIRTRYWEWIELPIFSTPIPYD